MKKFIAIILIVVLIGLMSSCTRLEYIEVLGSRKGIQYTLNNSNDEVEEKNIIKKEVVKTIIYPYCKITRDEEGNELSREDIVLEIIFNYDPKNLNIKIKDSWQLKYEYKDMRECLEYIRSTEEFIKIESMGYTRTIESQEREWYAHNVLYNWGENTASTRSVDLDENEGLFRRFIYFLLWLFF